MDKEALDALMLTREAIMVLLSYRNVHCEQYLDAKKQALSAVSAADKVIAKEFS